MKATRGDIASFKTVGKNLIELYCDLGKQLGRTALYTVLIPVHLVVWLWLPELSAVEKDRREAVAKAWADADV